MSKFFLYVGCLQALFATLAIAESGKAQVLEQTFVSCDWQNRKLEKAFADIQNQTDFFFTFDRRHISGISISGVNKRINLADLLKYISSRTGLMFNVSKDIILVKYDKAAEEISRTDASQPTSIELPVHYSTQLLTMSPDKVIYEISSAKIKEDEIIRGRVLSAQGEPLVGATVVIKESGQGTVTDDQGNFSINVSNKENTVLVVSYIGFQPREIATRGDAPLEVVLALASTELNEIVVTALGIERSKSDLNYAVQDLSTEALTQTRPANFINSISGKIAGVQITGSSGAVGSSSRIVIRGETTLGGSSQPLFVVDGIPVDNSNYKAGTFRGDAGGRGAAIDFGNTAGDLNPDDIASITVLKGPNAAALYGSRAANGVILITTKRGRQAKGLNVDVNSNFTFENPLILPEYQDQYGQGSGGQFKYVDGRGGGIGENNLSWGPALDQGLLIPQFFSRGEAVPWVSHPDNVKNFFETGATATNNFSISGGSETADFRLSATNLQQKGTIPNTDYRRNNVGLNAGALINGKLNVRASANYARTESDNIPGGAYDILNPMRFFSWFGRNVDVERLKNYRDEDGNIVDWNRDGFHSNIYFLLEENTTPFFRDRITGNLSATYRFTDWLSLTLRSGLDLYTDKRKQNRMHKNNEYPNGYYREDIFYSSEHNSDFLLNLNKNFFGEDLKFSFSVGGNQMRQIFERNSMEAPELVVPGLFNFSNVKGTPGISNFFSEKRINSVYAFTELAFRNTFFLELTGRNDWSSTLPVENNAYFYPSVSAGWVLTESFPGFKKSFLNFAKIRGGMAEVGGDTNPYQLEQIVSGTTAWGTTPAFTLSNTIANRDLKPQETYGYEIGTQLGLFNNRVNLDFTYYYKTTKNQILSAGIARSSGFATQVINAGEIENKGFEVVLNLRPLASEKGLNWDIDLNYSRNRNLVVALTEGIETFALDGIFRMNVRAKVGEPYGTLFGTGFKRDPQGNIVYSNGLPVTDNTARPLGNYQPDWIGGITNTFNYKGFNLSFLIDARIGGEMYSATTVTGSRAGVLKNTLVGRENDAVGSIVGVGVIDNGDGTYRPNDVAVSAQNYYNNYFAYANVESAIFDASFIKLRELRFGYDFPAKWLNKSPFRRANLSVVGRNLWLIHSNVPHIDPENAFASDYSQGIEFGALPTSRSMGFSLSFSF